MPNISLIYGPSLYRLALNGWSWESRHVGSLVVSPQLCVRAAAVDTTTNDVPLFFDKHVIPASPKAAVVLWQHTEVRHVYCNIAGFPPSQRRALDVYFRVRRGRPQVPYLVRRTSKRCGTISVSDTSVDDPARGRACPAVDGEKLVKRLSISPRNAWCVLARRGGTGGKVVKIQILFGALLCLHSCLWVFVCLCFRPIFSGDGPPGQCETCATHVRCVCCRMITQIV